MDQFRISATGHAVNYLPEYVAKAQGIFADHGLCVTTTVPQPWPAVLSDVNCGASHAALGGIWVPSMYRGRGRAYSVFAQVSERCPLSILGRTSHSTFSLEHLIGKTVLVSGGGGSSPFLFLSGLMSAAGLNPCDMRVVHDLAAPMLAELFSGGMGDYLIIDPVTAGVIARKGGARVVGCLSQIGGPVPWSVYYTLPERLVAEADIFGRFFTAIDESMALLQSKSLSELLPLFQALWPDTPQNIVSEIAERFQQNGMWETGAALSHQPFDTWQSVLAHHGFVEQPLSMEDIVCDIYRTPV